MNISFRLMMILDKTGKMSKPSLINPENDAAVNVTKTWEMDSSPYADNAIAYHTSTDWEIRSSSTDVTSDSLLYSSYTDTSNLTSINVILSSPYTIPRPIYARVRYWAGSISSDWSDFIEIKSEYCTPFSPTSGYVPYEVTHSAWGDSNSFMNKHAIWVEENGQTNNVLVGSIVSVYIKLTLSASDNLYTIQYACDDDCQVICSSSSQYQYIVNWGGTNNSSPGLNARGWASGISSNFTLPAGDYTFTFNLYNDPGPGTTWTANPGGSAFVITETTSGTVVSDSASWQGASNVEAVFCSGGSLGADGMCHCISSNMTTPSVSTSMNPVIVGTNFNMIGSPYIDSNLTSHKSSDWQLSSSSTFSDNLYVNVSGDTTNLEQYTTSVTSSVPSLLYARLKYEGTDGNLSSDWSADYEVNVEYCTPQSASKGANIYKVDASTSSSAQSGWNSMMKNHAIWVNYNGTDDTLMGEQVYISRSIEIPAGTYFVQGNADDSGSVLLDGKIILTNLGFTDSTQQTSTITVANLSGGSDTHVLTLEATNAYESDNTTWSGNPAGIAFIMYSGSDSTGTVFTDTADWPSASNVSIFYCPGSMQMNTTDMTCHCYNSSQTA